MSEVVNLSVAPRRPFEPHEGFFAAQRRNRRASWRMTAMSIAATALMGVPLTLVVTPALCAIGFLLADALNRFRRLPPGFWRSADHLTGLAFRALDSVLNHTPTDRATLFFGSMVLILPGAIASFVLWSLVLKAFRRAGVGYTLLRLGPRAPEMSRLKELELNDIVNEMSLAARMTRPKVLILETASANAATIGASHTDASIIVTEGLLDVLNREELEAVIAHLMASIGEADLPIAFMAESVFASCGVLLTLINAPFEEHARSALWRLLKALRGAAPSVSDGSEDLEAALNRDVDLSDTGVNGFFDNSRKSLPRRILWFVLFPVFITNFSIQLTLWAFSLIAVGPAMALLWRTRRYLADSCTLQFTRDPDGLASALIKLNSAHSTVQGAGRASHLFFVTAGSGGAANADASGLESRSVLSFHPSIRHRVERLRRMGSHVAPPKSTPGTNKIIVALSLLIGPFVLAAIVLVLILIAALILFNLVLLTCWVAAIHALIG